MLFYGPMSKQCNSKSLSLLFVLPTLRSDLRHLFEYNEPMSFSGNHEHDSTSNIISEGSNFANGELLTLTNISQRSLIKLIRQSLLQQLVSILND